MEERSADPQVIPYLLYADAGAAMDWLVRTFGFTVRARDARADGAVRHGELRLEHGGVVMVGSAGHEFQGPAKLGGVTQLVRITITELESHRDRATAAGAEASGISSGPSGWRSYSVIDPEGHQWYFTAADSGSGAAESPAPAATPGKA